MQVVLKENITSADQIVALGSVSLSLLSLFSLSLALPLSLSRGAGSHPPTGPSVAPSKSDVEDFEVRALCMYVCVYVCIYKRFMYVCTYVCMCVCGYTHTHTHTHTHINTYIHTYTLCMNCFQTPSSSFFPYSFEVLHGGSANEF